MREEMEIDFNINIKPKINFLRPKKYSEMQKKGATDN